MHRACLLIAVGILALVPAQMAFANCAIIDRLDTLHIVQTRLARDPLEGFFPSDIRQLRAVSADLGDGAIAEAVNGNVFVGQGAAFVKFVRATRLLLERASMDDPNSVRPHYTPQRRAALRQIGDYLTILRCTDDQIDVALGERASETAGATSDAEDMQQVAVTITRLGQEIFRLRTVIIIVVIGTAAAIIAPLLRQWLVLRRRRAKRHNTAYDTQYRIDEDTKAGVLLDINCWGTKLRHQQTTPMTPGDPIEIRIDDEWISGSIKWANSHYSGVAFDSGISLSHVNAVLAASLLAMRGLQIQNGAPQDAVSQ